MIKRRIMELDRQKLEVLELLMQVQSVSLIAQIRKMIESETQETLYELTDAQKFELDARIERHAAGIGKTSNWDEVKARIQVQG